jgi:LacI family transcriptional regulator
MPVTLKEIARQSGFSVTQVSRALAGHDDVSARTRDHIQQIADELGYRPNYIARQLQGRRTNTLGFVMPTRSSHEQDDFFSILLKGITHAASEQHYDVLMTSVPNEAEELSAYRRMAGERRVDGMIIARTTRNDPRINYLRSIDFPFIVHGRLSPNETNDFSFIDMDSQLGIEKVTSHLIERGHKRIGLILPPEHLAFTPYRLAGHQEVMDQHGGFDPSLCRHADLTFEGGCRAANDLLTRDEGITAIIGCNDWMALGAMSVAKNQGQVIGKDFAIAGYDDIPLASYSEPALTTVRQPIYEIGKQLAQSLIAQMTKDEPTVDIVQRLIEPELVVRDSSG